MKMVIPKKVKVGGLQYDVTCESGLNCSGETDNKALTIKLGTDIKPEAQEATFLHELLHAINCELPEKDVEFLAMALYAFLKDNPGIIR